MAGLTIKTIFSMVDKMSGPITTIKNSVKGFSKSSATAFAQMGSSGLRMGSLIAGAVAAVTTGKLAQAVQSFADNADNIGKTARVLGLGAQAFQEIAYAAKLQGVETETLEGGMKLLNKSLGEMQTKQGTLYTTLSKTNPELGKQLRSAKSTDEAFMLLMQAIDGETNAAKRAQLAQAAFGRGGQDLIKLTDGGIESFKGLRKEAILYGAAISDEAIAAGDEFGDSLDRLKGSLRGIANQGLSKIVEVLTPMIKKFTEFITVNRETIGLKLEKTLQDIGNALKFIKAMWDGGIIQSIFAGVAAFMAVRTAIKGVFAVMDFAKMLSNPFFLAALAIGAIVALAVVLIKNWDKVKVFFAALWDGIKLGATAAFDGIKVLGFTLADILLSTFGNIVKAVLWTASKIGGLIGFDVSGLDKAIAGIENLQKTMREGSIFGGKTGEQGGNYYEENGIPLSPNSSVIESRTMSQQSSTLDVNLNNLPAGTTTRQTGTAPGINVNTGSYGRGGLGLAMQGGGR